ncbi:MAG: alpha-L-fucosidase [Halobacteriaceae archaeon]
MARVPPHLTAHEDTYEDDPRAAALEWFEDAKYGLFLHYGLYSLLGNHEWVQYRERIPPAEYAQLREYFTAEGFDAEAVVDLAADAGMEYVTLTSKHHEGFCLFDSAQTTYTSVAAPCGRDLVGELAEACQARGLGLFLYYSVGVDWFHPHAPNREEWGDPARPDYEERPGQYADAGHDLDLYLDYARAQVAELCSEYGPIAGVWFDPAVFSTQPGKPGWDPEPFDLPALYETVRDLQSHALVSYKDGVTGTEDFLAPELYYEERGEEAERPGEVCATTVPGPDYEDEVGHSWGYLKEAAGKHVDADDVWDLLAETRAQGHNLLLNTPPLPDGSIDPEDAATLREVGERLGTEGFPGA